MKASDLRQMGRDLAERYAAHSDTYAAAGFLSDDEYRRAFVRKCWPSATERTKRHIREGWRSAR